LPQTRVDWDGLVADYDLIREDIEKVFPIFFDFNQRLRQPGGFRLRVAASERDWATPDKRAQFLLARGLDEDPLPDEDNLMLTTIRSHDQYNTPIYGLNDRYRGVTGRRDVIFMHAKDLAARGLKHGDRIDVVATGVNAADGKRRAVDGFVAVEYDIAEGSVAMYYPEGNALIALESHDRRSGTPAYKSVPVRITLSTVPGATRPKRQATHAV
jgi:anaerobic selenocysteine-containing dehydrogenase